MASTATIPARMARHHATSNARPSPVGALLTDTLAPIMNEAAAKQTGARPLVPDCAPIPADVYAMASVLAFMPSGVSVFDYLALLSW